MFGKKFQLTHVGFFLMSELWDVFVPFNLPSFFISCLLDVAVHSLLLSLEVLMLFIRLRVKSDSVGRPWFFCEQIGVWPNCDTFNKKKKFLLYEKALWWKPSTVAALGKLTSRAIFQTIPSTAWMRQPHTAENIGCIKNLSDGKLHYKTNL